MIESLISVGSFLIDIFRTNHGIDRDTQDRVSEGLIEIADLLDDVSYDLETNTYPHGKCAQMDLLAKSLYDALNGTIDSKNLLLLTENLNSAVEIEKLYAYKDDPKQICNIKIAAGYFRAASILVTLQD
jgi:hypothetical protein